jgi:hypothetical protein
MLDKVIFQGFAWKEKKGKKNERGGQFDKLARSPKKCVEFDTSKTMS